LAAVRSEDVDDLLAEAERQEIPIWRVGEVTAGSGVEVLP
jgi:hypothetical protein